MTYRHRDSQAISPPCLVKVGLYSGRRFHGYGNLTQGEIGMWGSRERSHRSFGSHWRTVGFGKAEECVLEVDKISMEKALTRMPPELILFDWCTN